MQHIALASWQTPVTALLVLPALPGGCRALVREKTDLVLMVRIDMARSEKRPAALKSWWANRTPEQREAHRQKISDSHAIKTWTKVKPRNPLGRQPGSRSKSMSHEAIQLRSLKQVQQASVKRILKDLIGVRPELIRDALIAGLMAPAPRSFPYVALAAAYLDGKPIDAEPANPQTADLSELTRDELLARACAVTKRLQQDVAERESLAREFHRGGGELPVIDVEPIRVETPAEELARLNAEIVEAEREYAEAQRQLEELKK